MLKFGMYTCLLLLAFKPAIIAAQHTRQQSLREIPVLCYHHVQQQPHQQNKMYISTASLKQQLKGLQDSGYQAILPQQLIAYYRKGIALPEKVILISFDDGHALQYKLAAPILDTLQWKAVFFVMTVTLNKKGYLSDDQIRKLHASGHVIGAHTWNHPNLTHFAGNWLQQLEQPRRHLETVTGSAVTSFAYPYGAMNTAVLKQVQQSGYECAFQLTGQQQPHAPLYALRRMMVDGRWSATQLIAQMQKNFGIITR